jgi:hypothetical protein
MKPLLSISLGGKTVWISEHQMFQRDTPEARGPLLETAEPYRGLRADLESISPNCGQQEKTPTPMEQVPITNFNLKQREMFARLLTQAKAEVQAELAKSDYAVDSEVKTEVMPKLAKENGASELITKVRRLQKEFDEAETALSDLGFQCDADSISLKYDAPKALREAVKTAEHAARQERNKVLKQYDLAILGVWASDDAAEAKRIVEGLL